MTIKLYDNDSYMRDFSAKVISCRENDDKFEVFLDKTCFFPEEGGQSCDKGFLNDANVLAVELTEEGIKHIVDKYLSPETEVFGRIDWEYRFSNMQMHSGEHIFSGLAHKFFGLNNVGFHLSDNSATMDFDGKLTAEQVVLLEEKANEAIWCNKKITAYNPDVNKLEVLEFRSKPKGIVGELRLVEIEGIDLCACCAPHVAMTGEIGLIKIISFENYKGGTRLNYLCGRRAAEFYYSLLTTTNATSRILNSKYADILVNVEKLQNDNNELKFKLNEFRRKNISRECSMLEKPILFLQMDNSDLLKYAINEMKNCFSGLCVVCCGAEESGYRFIAEDDDGDLTDIINALREKYGAKCGGRKNSIQGTINMKCDEITSFFVEYCQ